MRGPPELSSDRRQAALTSEGAYLLPPITEGPGRPRALDRGAAGKHLKFAGR